MGSSAMDQYVPDFLVTPGAVLGAATASESAPLSATRSKSLAPCRLKQTSSVASLVMASVLVRTPPIRLRLAPSPTHHCLWHRT